MKFLIFTLALLVCVYADVSELGYSYQQPSAPAPAPIEPERVYIPAEVRHPESAPINSYVPPPQQPPAFDPQNSYEPSQSVGGHAEEPVNTYIPPAPAPVSHEQALSGIEEIENTPADGYHYKTVRRVVYRHRS